jgi:hypothetical protein
MAAGLRLLGIGAHADDGEVCPAGLAPLYVRAGHRVRSAPVTNGDAGHHLIGGVEQPRRRLPFQAGVASPVPPGNAERRHGLERRGEGSRQVAIRWRPWLIGRYGPQRGQAVPYAGALGASAYGRPLDEETVSRVFPL